MPAESEPASVCMVNDARLCAREQKQTRADGKGEPITINADTPHAQQTGKTGLPRYWAFRITEALPIPYWQTFLLYAGLFFVVLLGALIASGARRSHLIVFPPRESERE